MENNLVKQDLQLGQETNWLTVVSDPGEGVMALKTDGTLWRWNFADDPLTHPDSAIATRLGTHSDWLAIHGDTAGFKGLAADGSLWFWRAELSAQNYFGQINELGLPPLIRVSRRPQKIGNIFAEAK